MSPESTSYESSQAQSSDEVPFYLIEATVSTVHTALLSGQTTCLAITTGYLNRIVALNPKINAVISLDPTSLATASHLDTLLPSYTSSTLPPLFGIPILLKDNFDLATLPTTSGSLRLRNSRPTIDAPTVTALKNAGAVILGKTNLHELALEGLSVSSLGGQTLNPYDRTRTPGGSSGGTGAAIAASFAVVGTGSDTVNSLRSPASACGLVSVKPTWGLVNRRGVVPNSWTQDTVGPIGRCVEDVARVLGVMASVGDDKGDEATMSVPRERRGVDHVKGLKLGTLQGRKVGVLQGFFDRSGKEETTIVNEVMDRVLERLMSEGVTVASIRDEVYDANELLKTVDTQKYEFREQIDAYLSRPELEGEHPSSLKDFFEGGSDWLVIPSQYEYVKTALRSSTNDAGTAGRPSYAAVKQRIADLKETLRKGFADNGLDAIVYPQQKNLVVKVGSPSQAGRNGILAAVTGFPVVALPAGYSEPSADAPLGVPIGFELLGLPYSEKELLVMAYQIERVLQVRRAPVMGEETGPAQELHEVPKVVPDVGGISTVYPRGRLSV